MSFALQIILHWYLLSFCRQFFGTGPLKFVFWLHMHFQYNSFLPRILYLVLGCLRRLAPYFIAFQCSGIRVFCPRLSKLEFSSCHRLPKPEMILFFFYFSVEPELVVSVVALATYVTSSLLILSTSALISYILDRKPLHLPVRVVPLVPPHRVASNKVTRDIILWFLGVASGRIAILSDTVEDAAVFVSITNNIFLRRISRRYVHRFSGTLWFSCIWEDGFVYQFSVSSDIILYAASFDCDGFQLDGGDLKQARLLRSQFMWRIIDFTWYVIL